MQLTVMSLNVKHGAVKTPSGQEEDRWPGLLGIIHDVEPDILLLQEANYWTSNWHTQLARAERDLGMRIHIGPSPSGAHTAVGHRPHVPWTAIEDRYASQTLHGFTHVRFDIGHQWPLVVISTHLNPCSAQAAATEMQLIAWRAHRYGGVALVGGDFNHCPLGDGDPDWSTVPPYNRSSRTVPGGPHEPLKANTIVSQIAQRAELTDIAAHLADGRGDQTLRAPTAQNGGVRVDWVLTTRAVLPAIIDYRQIDTRPYSDHDAVVASIDTGLIDYSLAKEAV